MPRLVLAAVLLLPLSVNAEEPRAEGRIETDEGRVEMQLERALDRVGAQS